MIFPRFYQTLEVLWGYFWDFPCWVSYEALGIFTKNFLEKFEKIGWKTLILVLGMKILMSQRRENDHIGRIPKRLGNLKIKKSIREILRLKNQLG